MISTSPRFKVNGIDVVKAFITAVLAVGATFVLGGIDALIEAAKGGQLCVNALPFASYLCHLDPMNTSFIAVTVWLGEMARRFFTDHQPQA